MTLGDDEVTLITNPITDESELACYIPRGNSGNGKFSEVTLAPLPGFRRIHRCCGERDFNDNDEDEESIVYSSSDSEEIPTLVPSGSFEDSSDEDTGTMPSGNKVGDLDPSLPWRRLRPPMTRGTSLPIATGHKDTRPKSAEFHLDLNQSTSRSKPPSGNKGGGKGHTRSPSDGDKHFLSLVRNGGNVRDRLSRDSPQRSPSPNSPSLLQRLGIFGLRRGCSKDKENIKTSASMELPAEQNNNNNGLDGQSNQSGATGDGRHRSRLRFRKYSAGAVTVIKDENQNQPPSPPIAVFSSDEDISSVPNTPKHNLPLPVATPTSILAPFSSCTHPLSTTTVAQPIQQQKPYSTIPRPPPSTSQPTHTTTSPPSTLSVVPSGEQNRNTGSSGIPLRTSSYWGNKRPRPISPRLEQEISTLLMSPTKPTAVDHVNDNLRPLTTNSRPEARTRSETRVRSEIKGQTELLLRPGLERRRGSDSKTLNPEVSRSSTKDVSNSKDVLSNTSEPSPPAVVTPQKVLSFATRPTLTRLREQGRVERAASITPEVAEVPYTRYRRYGERKHHSADMVEQTTPKDEPPRRGPQSSISEKSTMSTDGQRAYARHRHHTVEVANIIIKTPDGEREQRLSTQSSTYVASNIERRSGGSHRNIGIDSYRRISPGGAYIVHMSPSRWSRPNSGLEAAFNNQSPSESSTMPISQLGLRSAYMRAAAAQAAADNAQNGATQTSTNQRSSQSSAATPTTPNAVSTNQRASYSGMSNVLVNHRDSYSSASGSMTNHRGSYSGASSLSMSTSVPSNRTQRRTSSDDVTLFHHRVTPGSSIPASSHLARSMSSPSRSDPPAPPEPNRLSSGFPWVVSTRRGSRSSSPHAGVTTPTSLAARPESPMTPHPTSPRRSTPSSPHSSLPPSPATTSPRTSTSVVSSDLVDEFLIGVRRPLGRDRGYSPQDSNRGPTTTATTTTTPTRASDVISYHENGEKAAPPKTTREGVCGGVTVRRRTPHASPEKLSGRERPKSESLTVHWADHVSGHVTTTPDIANPSPRRDRRPSRDRPKSDLGGATAVSEALEHYELRDRVDSLAALPDGKTGPDPRMKTRRMSTPHPIKVRSERSPPNQHRARRGKLRRSRSAPDLMDRARRTKRVFQASSSQAGDLAVQPEDFSSDEEEEGCDSMSLETASETSSVSSIGRQAILDEIFEEEPPSYVEALWDHVTLDPEELGFRAGEVVEVTDMADKDWWWGKLRDREGWFPATFVRLRANQADTADDFAARVKEGLVDADLVLARYSPNLLSKDQARTNVVNEIMNAEREYAKHLRDVIEGYVEKCRKRPEMFKKEQMETIFSNIEAIYKFSQELLTSLEVAFMADAPQTSQIGNVFLKHSEGFTIYSEYCNNHPHACEELRSLQKSKKYQHFFEACRLLQQMIEIPLEGFLLTPVQKICKYPLQLNELLKYTRPEHADRKLLSEALVAMKRIAVLINERKRKMESLQKLEEWQELVQDWESPDLLESSSELIYCGELTKVNSSGWSQERIFFLFDFQIIYCKKDLLWRDIMVYKGRIDIDEAEVIPVEDGKDTQFNVTVRNGFKIYDRSKDKWYLLYARTQADKDRWLRSLEEERQRVELDRQNGFCLEEYRGKMPQYVARQRAHPDTKVKGDKAPKRKVLRMPFPYQHEQLKNIPSHVTLPRSVSSREALLYGQMSNKKRGWNPFSKVKTKR